MSKKTKKQSKKSETLKVVKKYDILRVDWFDHHSGHRQWQDIDGIKAGKVICTSIGMKVHEDKDSLVLVQSATSIGHASDSITILKSCINYKLKLGEMRYAEET